MRPPGRLPALLGAGLLALAALPAPAPAAPPRTAPGPAPRAYLIYLIDGQDPIVVTRYVEEGDQVRFEKYGGWVGIPRYEVLRIVPDEAEAPGPAGGETYVALRGGAAVRADEVAATESLVRVRTPEGSLTFPRADLVGVLRLAPGTAPPEAWITLVERAAGGTPGPAPRAAAPGPEVPPLSHRPHLLQLRDGALIRVDGFWIEDGQIRFRRLGGVVGFALAEVARLLPQEPESTRGRTAARFVRRLGGDRLEVRLGRAVHRIHLIGVEPRNGRPGSADPWEALRPGETVGLEFDRRRYAPGGAWLAYVYLPSGRMLNAELIRAGLARPRLETENVRYVDLFQEIWTRRLAGNAPGD